MKKTNGIIFFCNGNVEPMREKNKKLTLTDLRNMLGIWRVKVNRFRENHTMVSADTDCVAKNEIATIIARANGIVNGDEFIYGDALVCRNEIIPSVL
jgi:hypothetical protein